VNIDRFMDRTYDKDSYNCAHFVCEVWNDVTGEPISDLLACFLLPRQFRHVGLPLRRSFYRLGAPVPPCLALFSNRRDTPHVGIFLRGGRILELTKAGVRCLPLEIVATNYQKVEFFKCKPSS
jgi:hypothetical protein